MGFLDKVKEQAEKAKGQAQDLKVKVGDKVEEVQGKRKADDLLADLGRFVYAEHTGRALPGADTEVPRIVGELQGLEADGATILPATATATAAPPADPGAEPEPPVPSAAASATAAPPDLPV